MSKTVIAKKYLLRAVLASVVFGVLDSLWFGLFMQKFALNKLEPLLRLSGNKLDVSLGFALIAYFFMVVLAVFFVDLRGNSARKVFFKASLFGICVFGIYDCTNGALLKVYPLEFVLVDTLWGGVLYGTYSVIAHTLSSKFSV